jgi:hypothetical protein
MSNISFATPTAKKKYTIKLTKNFVFAPLFAWYDFPIRQFFERKLKVENVHNKFKNRWKGERKIEFKGNSRTI